VTRDEPRFVVAWTGDFQAPDGTPRFRDVGRDRFDGEPRIVCRTLPEHRAELGPDQIAGAQGVIVLSSAVTAQSVSQANDLLAIGRFGVGYDAVDVPACTAADVLVFITAGAVDRSVAEATVAWMLALSHHVAVKDHLARQGRWDERSAWMGRELRDRTLGVVGLGGIGRALVTLLNGFGMAPPIAHDPFVTSEQAQACGVRLVPLDELMSTADFISINCPLNASTRGLIGHRELSRMKPDAFLINTARGGIVDEDALYDLLAARRIAGAAIDVFVQEPLTVPPRFAGLDNVLLAPHCIAWTEELFRDIGRSACGGMLDLAHGTAPRGVVNPEVLNRAGFQRKWDRLRLDRPPPGS
jgi:phosphoglycerate dehydrogenase-like enzyme